MFCDEFPEETDRSYSPLCIAPALLSLLPDDLECIPDIFSDAIAFVLGLPASAESLVTNVTYRRSFAILGCGARLR